MKQFSIKSKHTFWKDILLLIMKQGTKDSHSEEKQNEIVKLSQGMYDHLERLYS